MNGQVDLFGETAQGKALRREGQKLVTDNVDERWRRSADVVIHELARSGRPFTADDVRQVVGAPPSGKVNAMGARFGAASRTKVIEACGSQLGSRKEQHARRLTVWRGRI